MKKIQFLLFSFFAQTCCFGQDIPEEYYVLTKRADSLFQSKLYKTAAFTYSDAFKTIGWKGFPEDRYKAAVSWALAAYPDSAIFNLKRIAVKSSFSDYTRVSNDKNFNSLHKHTYWKPLMTKIKANADSILIIEAKRDKKLIRRLDSLVKEDQKWRNLSRRYNNNEISKDSITAITISHNLMTNDSLNFYNAREIFYNYGFPNYDLVGESGAGDFWLLVQHQDRHPTFQDSVLVNMRIEAKKGKASWSNYAYLVDRVKVNTGQEQIYGTQMRLNQDSTSFEPQPVLEPLKLNDRRKTVGLGPIERYTETMNTRYQGSLRKK